MQTIETRIFIFLILVSNYSTQTSNTEEPIKINHLMLRYLKPLTLLYSELKCSKTNKSLFYILNNTHRVTKALILIYLYRKPVKVERRTEVNAIENTHIRRWIGEYLYEAMKYRWMTKQKTKIGMTGIMKYGTNTAFITMPPRT